MTKYCKNCNQDVKEIDEVGDMQFLTEGIIMFIVLVIPLALLGFMITGAGIWIIGMMGRVIIVGIIDKKICPVCKDSNF